MSRHKTNRCLLLALAGGHLAWSSAAQELPAITGETNLSPALKAAPPAGESILAALPAPAAEAPAAEVPPSPPPVLKTSIEAGEIIGDHQVQHVFLSFGTNECSFILPEFFHVESSTADKLVIINQGYDCLMTVRLVEPATAERRAPDLDACRRILLNRYAYAKISEEYERSVANHSGPAFDFTWQNSAGGRESGRMIFVRTAAGILEFTLLTATDKFAPGEHAFSSVVLTFRTNENGVLEVVRIAERA